MMHYIQTIIRPLALVAVLATSLMGQNMTQEKLLNPSADSWPMYHGDYSGQRHSSLTQITPDNVGDLTMAWAFQTGERRPIKASPLVVDGVIYLSVPNIVWAVDARTGHQLWRYQYPDNDGFHIGSRGVSMYKDWLFFVTPDAHLISLNAKDGTVRWDVEIADAKRGYWATLSPLVIRNHVMVGVSGDFDNLAGFIKSIDPETGETQWRWDSTPPAGTPGATTGGMTWMSGTYDPELNLLYWGTGNPTPVLNGRVRPGDNLYTGSIVALNPDTGKLQWAFQASPHDTHDWDAAEVPVLVDAEIDGTPRKLVLQASRNGYYFVLDRTTGENLVTKPFGPVNWTTGIDEKGQPIPNPEKEPAPDGRIIAPDEAGLTNYRSPSFDPETGVLIVSTHPSYSIYFNKDADGAFGWAGADYSVWGTGVLKAIDFKTGDIKWTHALGQGTPAGGVLTTASGLTFTGDIPGNALALRTSDGTTLWHAGGGAKMQSQPITYMLDGRQYVVTGIGGVLFAWALPE
jgi:alcohol dehydrogenase (cytochrome c)